MSEKCEAVVAGHICLDMIPALTAGATGAPAEWLVPGRLIEVGPMPYATGGAVSNTGLALLKLGVNTRLMGKTGRDLFGQAIKQVISAYSASAAKAMVVDPAVSSSYTVIISPPGIDRTFLHCPGANDSFGADDVRYNRLESARLFHFGYPPLMRRMYAEDGRELTEIFRRAKETGVTTSLDMALPDASSAAGQANWRAILKNTLPYVDIFLPSIEEILFMLRPELYHRLNQATHGVDFLSQITPALLSDLSAELLDSGARITALKLGRHGLYLKTADLPALKKMGRACPPAPTDWANRELWTPCFEVKVAGTTGAGDATIAGFICALLRGLSPEQTLTAAVAVGACNVEAPDALSGIATWEDTVARVNAGWPKHPHPPQGEAAASWAGIAIGETRL